MSKRKFSGQVLLIMTGFVCNNNCLMCSVKPKSSTNIPRNTQEIISDIEEGIKQKYKRIEFTGGEPTVRKDLLELITKAHDVGFGEIAMSTNCRTLSHMGFLKSLQKQGLNRVTTTIYGFNPETHDNITRAPGSFEQSIQGIKNLLSLGINVSVNTVVFSQTVDNLKKTGEYLASIGVQHWTLLDLIPDGYVTDNYDQFSINPDRLKIMFKELEPVFSKFNLVSIMDFPYCLFPSEMMSKKKIVIFNAEGRSKMIKLVGYTPKRYHEKSNVYFDVHKIRSKKCRQCAYYDGCGGSWISYFKRYNDSFITPFSEIIKGEKNN